MSMVFITGGRNGLDFYPGTVALEMLRAVAQGHQIATGDVKGGVEELVQLIGAEADVPVVVFPSPPRTPDGKRDWDTRHKALVENEVTVVAIHVDPHVSPVIQSLSAIMPDDELRIVTPATV